MARIQRPRPSFLDGLIYVGFKNGNQIWKSPDGDRFHTWDSLHGEIEVFNKRGRHLGAAHAMTGAFLKPPVKGRSIDVS